MDIIVLQRAAREPFNTHLSTKSNLKTQNYQTPNLCVRMSCFSLLLLSGGHDDFLTK